MKPINFLLALGVGAATFAPILRAQSDFQKPYLQYSMLYDVNITDGDLRVYARQQDPSGLLHDVIVELADDNSILMRAQYARRNAKGEWILRDVQSYHFGADGTLGAQTRAERFTVYSGKNLLISRGVANLKAVVTDGGLQLRAARQENGLLRDVLIKAAQSQSKTDPATTEFGPSASMRIFAKYARRDSKQPMHWILGDAVIHNFNADGSLSSEERLARMEVWTQFQGEGQAPVFIFKKEVGTPVRLRIFAREKPKTSAPATRGFQFLSQSKQSH